MQILTIARPFHSPNIAIKTDCDKIIDQIICYYGEYAITGNLENSIEIIISKYSEDKYTLTYGDNNIETESPLQEISRIAFEITAFDENILALHAAAVEHQDKAYVFVASTTSGKTTLTAFLTAQGMGYITDDCVMIDKKDLSVYPFTVPMHLRDGGLEALKTNGVFLVDLQFIGDEVFGRYVYTPKNSVKNKLSLAGIYFISRSKNENSIANLTTTQAIGELLKSPITEYKMSVDYLRFLAKVAGTGCKRLIYKDMEFVKRSIEGFS